MSDLQESNPNNNNTTTPQPNNNNTNDNNTNNNNTNNDINNTNNNDNQINKASIDALLERTGYQLIQENGQRRYCPKQWDREIPSKGCEVFVGKLPRDCFEDELMPVLERAGTIYECRIMIDFDKRNRGFCFVTYATRSEARTAVKELNNYEIREKRYLGICHSVDNCRLFVGGIPLDKKEDEVAEAMKQVCEGVVKAIVYSSASDKSKNRGFAFVEFENHKMAAHSRRKLMKSNFRLWGVPVAVDWAEPEIDVDEDVMSKVKILYVRNLMPVTSEEGLMRVVVGALVDGGEDQEVVEGGKLVEKVKKLKDFAFVHFKEREDALKVMEALHGTTLDGSRIEVTLAKPTNKDNNNNNNINNINNNNYNNYNHGYNDSYISNTNALIMKTSKLSMAPNHHYPLPSTPFMTSQAYYPIGEPLINNCYAYNSSIQTGTDRHRGTNNHRGSLFHSARKAGGMGRTYGNRSNQSSTYDLPQHGDIQLIPVSSLTLKPLNQSKSPVQVLEEMCMKNGWSMPVYQLNQVQSGMTSPGQQLFVYKLFLPSLSSEPYVAKKVSRSVEEAMKLAAENALACLGCTSAPQQFKA